MHENARLILVAFAALAAVSCHGPSAGSGRDAGPPLATPRAVHPRISAPGEYPVDVEKSQLSLSVIKDRDTTSPVVATLRLRDGAVSLDGTPPSARLSVDLDSFDSSIPLRNERVRGIFFETSALGWETAELTVPSIPADVVQTLRQRKIASHVTLDAKLQVHGQSEPLTLLVDAGYADDGRLWVKTASPAQVKISGVGLAGNLRRLSSICMHDSIDDIVNITASFEFATK